MGLGVEAKPLGKPHIVEWCTSLHLWCSMHSSQFTCRCSQVRTQTCESLASFLTWPWCNQNRTRAFRTERQCFSCCSTNYAFNTQYMIFALQQETFSKLPTTFTLFPVLSFRVRPHTIKVSLPPLNLWHFSRDKKYQALHVCTTSMSTFWSLGKLEPGKAWEQGCLWCCRLFLNGWGQPPLYIMRQQYSWSCALTEGSPRILTSSLIACGNNLTFLPTLKAGVNT